MEPATAPAHRALPAEVECTSGGSRQSRQPAERRQGRRIAAADASDPLAVLELRQRRPTRRTTLRCPRRRRPREGAGKAACRCSRRLQGTIVRVDAGRGRRTWSTRASRCWSWKR
ncbi:MAG: hypothetical protein U5Q44_01620 [Dehalococcoidia bacterium]|nr:hypothetical protein [Dehalococcoidia bacterium]